METNPTTTRYRATHLGDVLRVQGRTQTWLAQQLGSRQQRLTHLINGRDTVSPDTAERIARALQLPPACIFEPFSPN